VGVIQRVVLRLLSVNVMNLINKIKSLFKSEKYISGYSALQLFLKREAVSSDELQMMLTIIEKDRTLLLRTKLHLKTWALNKYARDGYKSEHIVN
jgi:hypothetical protein